MREIVLDVLCLFVTLVLIPGLPLAFQALISFLGARAKATWAEALTARLGQVGQDVVFATSQVLGDEIKKAKDPSSPGGKSLTPDERTKMFQHAFEAGLKALGGSWVKKADKVLGEGTVAANLKTAIEAEVKKMKLFSPQKLEEIAGKLELTSDEPVKEAPKKDDPLPAPEGPST